MYVNYHHDPLIFSVFFVGKVLLYVCLGIIVPHVFWLIYDSFYGDAYRVKKPHEKKSTIKHYQRLSLLFLGSYDLFLALYSVLFEYETSACTLSHLTRMTETQVTMLEIVLFWDCFDIGLAIGHGILTVPMNDIIYHHLPSIVGIGYQLCNNVGGGLMALFLLDGATQFVGVVEDLLKSKKNYLRRN
jgi:hypothetical protein